MKFTVPAHKARNPLVAPCRMRRAGAHRPSSGAARQRAQAALRHALSHERTPPY